MSGIGSIDENVPGAPPVEGSTPEEINIPQDDQEEYDPNNQPEWGEVSIKGFMFANTTKVQATISQTGVYCYDNTCDTDGGCAKCKDFYVNLPLNAQIRGVYYLSTANYPEDVPIRRVGAGEQAWAYMTPYETSTTATNIIVSSKFYNRSHNRDRVGGLEVIWE